MRVYLFILMLLALLNGCATSVKQNQLMLTGFSGSNLVVLIMTTTTYTNSVPIPRYMTNEIQRSRCVNLTNKAPVYYHFDSNGNITSSGNYTYSNVYDANRNLITQDAYKGWKREPVSETVYSYDALGILTQAVSTYQDYVLVLRYVYQGGLLSSLETYTTNGKWLTAVYYAYEGGRLSRYTAVNPDKSVSFIVSFIYDAKGLLLERRTESKKFGITLAQVEQWDEHGNPRLLNLYEIEGNNRRLIGKVEYKAIYWPRLNRNNLTSK